jgi:translation initiation factor IF-2
MAEIEVGKVTHYFGKIGVAGIKLSGTLAVGNRVHILGHTTDLMETIESLEVNKHSVERVEAGAEIGLKVTDHVREHDTVYRIE